MISDEDVKRLFKKAESFSANDADRDKPIPPQIVRGIGFHVKKGHHPGGCKRHMAVFDKFNVIPKYCFNCYKVLIEPRTVVELFKLMVVFHNLKLPGDNTRKCMAEVRENVSGTYKGYIYCTGIEDGLEVMETVPKVIQDEISKNIPVSFKRGCSEYAIAYPEYAKIGQGMTPMEYKEEWQEYENIVDQNYVVDPRLLQLTASDTHNSPGYTLKDARVMRAWLVYAATIGDLSYLKISDMVLPPFTNLKRPSSFHPLEDN